MTFFRLDFKLIFYAALFHFFSTAVYAANDDAKAHTIAKQNACLGCHAINKKVVGPSFQDVAKKYANNAEANRFLKSKILKGGSGSWGVVPMPGNSKLNDEDLSLMVSWILRGAPSNN
jgi:cytochrome c